MEEREMNKHRIAPVKYTWNLCLRMFDAVAPGTGKHRVNPEMRDLKIQLTEAHERIEILDNETTRQSLLIVQLTDELQESASYINELHDKLSTAMDANIANENMVSFDMPDRPINTYDPDDQVTHPIDVRKLREELSRARPLVGKVLQVDPETGVERTVETPLSPRLSDFDKLKGVFESMGHRLGKVRFTGLHVVMSVTDDPTKFPQRTVS